MATKKIKHDTAEKRFVRKVLQDDVNPHNPVFKWTGEIHKQKSYDHQQGIYVDDDDGNRDKFEIKCDNKTCGALVFRSWHQDYVNENGAVPAASLTTWNNHILASRAKREAVVVSEEAALIIEVQMIRGSNHEYWVVHQNDKDWWEAVGFGPYTDNHRLWRVCWKDTRGWKRWANSFGTRDEAVGYCLSMKVKYERKGYVVTVKQSTDSGVVPVAATVAISVRKLINDYKELSNKDNPGVMKKWLDNVNDALTTMELLETLRDEVQEDFAKAMVL